MEISNIKNSYFQKRSDFKFKPLSIFLFAISAATAWGMNIAVLTVFPSQNVIPYLARTTIQVIIISILIIITARLLKQNNLTGEALGLKLNGKNCANFLLGAVLGMLALGIFALLLYIFTQYHFVTGTLTKFQLLQESYSYFLGNFLEELIFRGFLLVIFSQLIGWRKAVWLMVLPFGLFHLPGLGLGVIALKMILTTTIYAFIFSYAYVATGSIWTAIGVHVSSNIFLHAVTGLDGANKAVFMPIYTHGLLPYDLSFVLFSLTSIFVAVSIFFLIDRYKLT